MHSFYINENDEYDLDESDEEDSLSGLHMVRLITQELTHIFTDFLNSRTTHLQHN